jgi:predicted protein tyrosine phosphatase
MIAAVDFVSLDVFLELKPAPDLLAISIGDPADLLPANLTEFADALRVQFLDCCLRDVHVFSLPASVLCSAAQLELILCFVRRHHARPQRCRLVVHCRMGSSRSAAVALVAHHLTDCDFPRLADAHYANEYVLELASETLRAYIAAPRRIQGAEPHAYLPLQLQI